MGQAKNRGSFEQRKAEAMERNARIAAERHKAFLERQQAEQEAQKRRSKTVMTGGSRSRMDSRILMNMVASIGVMGVLGSSIKGR